MRKDVFEKALERLDSRLRCMSETRYAEGRIDKFRIVRVWLEHENNPFVNRYTVMAVIYAKNNKGKYASTAPIGGSEHKYFGSKEEKANKYFDDIVKKHSLKEKKLL